MAVGNSRPNPARGRRTRIPPIRKDSAASWGNASCRAIAFPPFSLHPRHRRTGGAVNGPVKFGPVAEGWTKERIALLHRHFMVGLTAAESAILLGGVSKNAVVAKRSRLGLVGFAKAEPTPEPVKPRQREPDVRLRREPRFRRVALPDMDGPLPPDAAPKPLAQHRRGECVWPLGAADQEGDWRTLFCCAPILAGRRYCPAHTARSRHSS